MPKTTIGCKSINASFKSRENNFDIIRLIAATLVIFSHSFPLSLGATSADPFNSLTKGQETYGGLGVSIFFIISGFLITYSYEKSANVYVYIRNRILRIYPALLFVLFFTVFILGPILTSKGIKSYFLDGSTLGYLESFMLINMHYSLPGVFEHNPYPNAINGSLWTLWYEFFFYIVVAVLGSMKLIRKYILLPVFIIVLYISLELKSTYAMFYYFDLFKYFCMGMLFYLFRNEIKLNKYLAIISLLILIISTWSGYYKLAFIFLGTYIIFYLGLGIKKYFKAFQDKGDFSYGMYIYAFPIQQLVSYLLKDEIKPINNFFISLPITFIASVFSWYIIERRALSYKKTKIITMETP